MTAISALTLFRLCAYAGLGALAAHAFLRALRWNAFLYGRGSTWAAVFVHGLRLLALAAVLVALARAGAGTLLAALAGFQIVRIAILRHETTVEAA